MKFSPVLVFVLCAVAACDVGDVTLNHSGGDGGATDSSNAGGDSGNGCVNAQTPAAAHTHAAGGTSNAGMDCVVSGCHGTPPGTGASTFTFAGTLYTSSAASAPKTGATIQIKFGTTTYTAISDMAGNFYNSLPLTFPATTDATSCPSLTPMLTALATGQGGCNSCHRNAGTTTPMYLQ